MSHEFKLNHWYRNRERRYRVLAIRQTTVKVQYEDGSVEDIKASILWRIWDNLGRTLSQEPARRTSPTAAQPTSPATGLFYRANSAPSGHLGGFEAEESTRVGSLWSSGKIRWDGMSSQLISSDDASDAVGHRMPAYNRQQDGELSAFLSRIVNETLKSKIAQRVVAAVACIGHEVFATGMPNPQVGLYSVCMQRLARGLLESPDLLAKSMSRAFKARRYADGVGNFVAQELLGLYLRACLLAGENVFISHIDEGRIALVPIEPLEFPQLRTIAEHTSWTLGQRIGVRTLDLLAPDQAEDEVWVQMRYLVERQDEADKWREERPVPWDGVIELVNESWRKIRTRRRYGVPSQGRAEMLTSENVSDTIGLRSVRFVREGAKGSDVYVRFHFGEDPRRIAIGRIVAGGELEGFPELVPGSGLLKAVMRSIAVAYYRDLVTPDEVVYYTSRGGRRGPSPSGRSSPPRLRQLPRPRRIQTGPRGPAGSIHSFRDWVQERARHTVVGHTRWVGSYFRADQEKRNEAREAGVHLENGYTWVREHGRGGPGSAGAGGSSWDLSARTIFSPPEDASNSVDELFWR